MSSQSLAIVYTANLHADFNRMPRVFSVIQRIRNTYGTAPFPILTLDIGGAWSDDNWASQITGHRAPYLVMDAMGYNIIRADGLDVGGIIGLKDVMQTQLMDDSITRPWTWHNMLINVGTRASAPGIRWEAHTRATEGNPWYVQTEGVLTLLPMTDVGHLHVHYPEMTVINAERRPVEEDERPDASIVATIEYIESEARYYASKNEGEHS